MINGLLESIAFLIGQSALLSVDEYSLLDSIPNESHE